MKIESEKTGLAVVTCNRPDFFKKCINSIPILDEVIVINDGNPYENDIYPSHITKIINHKKNKGIAFSKNEALNYLLNKRCKHIFLCEDDIALKSSDIISKYILASKVSGIYHFNYGYHGKWNRDENGEIKIRHEVKYNNDISIVFNRELTGAFSYYRDDVINTVGFMDTFYKNILEHVDHTFKIIKKGFHPPLYWFADLKDSSDYILELDPKLDTSNNLTNTFKFKFRLKLFTLYFILKNGKKPHKFYDCNIDELKEYLFKIKKQRATL